MDISAFFVVKDDLHFLISPFLLCFYYMINLMIYQLKRINKREILLFVNYTYPVCPQRRHLTYAFSALLTCSQSIPSSTQTVVIMSVASENLPTSSIPLM